MVENLVIKQGATFNQIILWETAPIVYKAITAITKTAPVRLTVPSHSIPDGWDAAIVSVKGMTQINAKSSPPKKLDDEARSDYKRITVIDPSTVEVNSINAADFSTYTSGGYLQYNTPVNLTGYSARMTIKDRIGGTALLELTTTAPGDGITIDVNAYTIELTLSATDTAALTWTKGVYDLEMVSAGGVVTPIMNGTVTVTKEVTTT